MKLWGRISELNYGDNFVPLEKEDLKPYFKIT